MKQIKPYKEDDNHKYFLKRFAVGNEKAIRIITILIIESYTNREYEYYVGSTILNPEDTYNNELEMKIVEGRAHKRMEYWHNNIPRPFAVLSPGIKSQKILNGFFQKILSNIIRRIISKLSDTKGKLDVEELEGNVVPELIVKQPMV